MVNPLKEMPEGLRLMDSPYLGLRWLSYFHPSTHQNYIEISSSDLLHITIAGAHIGIIAPMNRVSGLEPHSVGYLKIIQRTLFGIQCSRLITLPYNPARSVKSLVCVGIVPTLGLAT